MKTANAETWLNKAKAKSEWRMSSGVSVHGITYPGITEVNQRGNMQIATDTMRAHILTNAPGDGECKLSASMLEAIDDMLTAPAKASFTAPVFHLQKVADAAIAYRCDRGRKTAPRLYFSANSRLKAWTCSNDNGNMLIELENGYDWPVEFKAATKRKPGHYTYAKFDYSHTGENAEFAVPPDQLADALSGLGKAVTVDITDTFIRLTGEGDNKPVALISLWHIHKDKEGPTDEDEV